MTTFFLCLLSLSLLISPVFSQEAKPSHSISTPDIEAVTTSYLGNHHRNYYGNKAPNKLDVIWKFNLGSGKTQNPRKPYDFMLWYGAGWTGQPVVIREDSSYFLVQPSYSHNLYKINAETGEEIWRYKYDDVIKGSPTFWENTYAWGDDRFMIFQGSRRGNQNTINSPTIHSLRAISYLTGKPLWYYNSERTRCYSRDVDGSLIIHQDTLYLPLENGYFLIADPRPDCGTIVNERNEPKVYDLIKMYSEEDANKHGNNVIMEASPTLLGDRIYMCSGSGWIKGYNIKTDSVDWAFYTGADMDGTPVVTNDSCLIVTIEKQYIPGKGGVFKFDPTKSPEESVVWYFPTENKKFAFWDGGILGSACVNDAYIDYTDNELAAVQAMDGNLYILDHEFTTKDSTLGPLNKHYYPMPQIAFQYETGPGISTPIMTENTLVVAGYKGIHLFKYNNLCNFERVDHFPGSFESTPVFNNGKVYIACRDGYLYCFGEKHVEE
jgi:outer membrane protein assembly factor BamB